MPRVYVSVGSNIGREVHIRAAVSALAQRYGELVLSSVYETRPVGFDGPDFYNMVVGFETEEHPLAIVGALKAVEVEHARDRAAPRFADRTLDLDLLLYGDRVVQEPRLSLPRSEIVEHAFVLAPLAELAGDEVHPVVHKTYRELWQSFDAPDQELWPVDLRFEGAAHSAGSVP